MTGQNIWKLSQDLNKKKRRRLDWKKKSTGEAGAVVKGTNKRVVVVRSPDPKIFDEAIFIIRDDYLQKNPDGAKALLEEARRAADEYVRSNAGAGRRPIPRKFLRPLYAAAGAAAAGAAWLAVRFVGVLF